MKGGLSHTGSAAAEAPFPPAPCVRRAITLRGPELSEAILLGHKDIENRHINLGVRWVALHTGQGTIEPELGALIEHLSPGLPPAQTCPKGAVVGVCFVQGALTFEALRQEQGCGSDCEPAAQRHSPTCRLSPYAIGPVCNIISMAVRLPRPVSCRGQLGCWTLPLEVRQEVEEQLVAMSPQEMRDASWCTPPSQVPHAWPLPWLPLGSDGTCRHGRFPPRLTPSAAALTPARHAAERRRQRRPRARSAATTSSTARSCSRSRRPPSSAVRAASSLAAATASPSVSMRSRPRSRSPRSTGALGAPGNAGSRVSSQTSEGERELRPKRGAFPHGKTRASRDHTGGGHGRDLGCSGGGASSAADLAPGDASSAVPSGAALAEELSEEMSVKKRSGSRHHLCHLARAFTFLVISLLTSLATRGSPISRVSVCLNGCPSSPPISAPHWSSH